jgi:phytanoyl-CoA hydroxylase
MQTPSSYYQKNGYFIFKNLIPIELIDDLLSEYNSQILPSKRPFFRQSSSRWETNKLSECGYCIESFLDPHDYPNYPSFSNSINRILCSQPVRDALKSLTNSEEHNLMQSMFFDFNTATPSHQDWYYLDSIPNGHLLAGWFALEDIHEEAGRFYVLPGSHQVDFDLTDDEKISLAPYLKKLEKYVESQKDQFYAPALQKGDVLFWNSRTIHGSNKTLNQKYSRKSITAHYLPSQYQFGKRYAEAPFLPQYTLYEGMKLKLAPNSHKNYSWANKLKTNLFTYLWYRPQFLRIAKLVQENLLRFDN